MRSDYKKEREQAKKAADSLFKISAKQFGDPASSPFPCDESVLQRRSKVPADPAIKEPSQSKVQAREFLFGQIEHLQRSFPNTMFARLRLIVKTPVISTTGDRILDAIGSYNDHDLIQFWMWV